MRYNFSLKYRGRQLFIAEAFFHFVFAYEDKRNVLDENSFFLVLRCNHQVCISQCEILFSRKNNCVQKKNNKHLMIIKFLMFKLIYLNQNHK